MKKLEWLSKAVTVICVLSALAYVTRQATFGPSPGGWRYDTNAWVIVEKDGWYAAAIRRPFGDHDVWTFTKRKTEEDVAKWIKNHVEEWTEMRDSTKGWK